MPNTGLCQELDAVFLPCVQGVLPGHVPTIAQLQPGLVSVEYDVDGVSEVRAHLLHPAAVDYAKRAVHPLRDGHAPLYGLRSAAHCRRPEAQRPHRHIRLHR